MNRPKVFLTGGDDIGWALDEDLKLIREAVENMVELVGLPESEVVHTAWWEGLTMYPRESLAGKRIICHVPGEPFRYFTVPGHRLAMSMVGRWVTRTKQAASQLSGIGIRTNLIPYLVDVDTFKPLPPDSDSLRALRSEWEVPENAYLIASFQRDTEGSDLKSPKLVKGPDILLEILLGLKSRGQRSHVLLAGPRRHWLLGKLREEGIPFTYVGRPMEADDIKTNSLPRPILNLLYNLADLYIVASRSEGGPHSVLEAAACRCKIISTPVGTAPDILEPSCLFKYAAQAVHIIEGDMAGDLLAPTLKVHYERVQSKHRPESVMPLFQKLYESLEEVPRFRVGKEDCFGARSSESGTPSRSSHERNSPKPNLTIGLWHSFFKPPYGGGNQFMLALRKALALRDMDVRENELRDGIDAYILNSIHFDVDRFMEFSLKHRLNVIHRIDGPIHLIRGFDREKDELCFQLNERFASATVLQSAWTYQRIVDMGYNPVSPTIIHNAVDSDIFHSQGRRPFDRDRKVRLISTSWSNNPRKGGPTYRWIEDHLDWDCFEYTFVGNASEKFERIQHIPPVSSDELAEILRNHDIYITASRNDPCSNALIEAMACGLPALYLNDGGHPELVGAGGLAFQDEEEILPQLERLVEHYESFQRLIAVPRMEDVAEKYLALVRELAQ
jgi:glycosyltransferase involved in cell wall biosynthesis